MVENTRKTVDHLLRQMPDVFEFESELLSTTMLLHNAKGQPQRLRGRPLPTKHGIRLRATATTARVATFLTGEFMTHSLLADYKILDLLHEGLGAKARAAMLEMGRI